MIKFSAVSKAYGSRTLLEEASFSIGSGERVALVGRNGSGKSTLFKLILEEEEVDDGTISVPNGYLIGHLAQHLHFEHENIVAEVSSALPADQLGEDYRAKIILSGLGFEESDMHLPASRFSGGFQIRVNLARLLVSQPHMLLLDEPTNYLDILSARWLMQFLRDWEGEMILISHDRDFLDQVATHSMLIHRKNVKKMRGTTMDLYQQVADEEERYEQTRINEDKKRQHIEAFVNRFRAKASKASQVQSRIKALDKMGRKQELQDEDQLAFRFRETPEFHGKYLLEARDLTFSYPGSRVGPLIQDLSLTLAPGDRVGIIGKNGRGKSTLLKILAGELKPDQGEVKLSTHARLGYFGQTNIERLNPQLTIESEIYRSNENLSKTETRSICGAMMFSGDDALKKISVLSGGERSRVLLGKIIALPTNVLLLDEPTNHLDMESIEALVDSCQDYQGAIAIVTHSEHILRSLVTKIIVFSPHGPVLVDGDYDYFLEKHGWEEEFEANGSQPTKSRKVVAKPKELSSEEKKKLKELKQEIVKIEQQIVKLEKNQKKQEEALAQASQQGESQLIIDSSKELAATQKQIEQLFSELEKVDTAYRQGGGE